MSFNDMELGEPNAPLTQSCLVMWKDFAFRWGDYRCHILLSYICEFMYHQTGLNYQSVTERQL